LTLWTLTWLRVSYLGDSVFRVFFARARGLRRFCEAQDANLGGLSAWERALNELRVGRKQSHWMWFVFPQAKGLGESEMSRTYALSPREARRYLTHDVLANRLLIATALVVVHLQRGKTLDAIFGPIDALKFRSSMELFTAADGLRLPIFTEALALSRQAR
jgi:uncharacterized protein (DUF1810 family)